MALSKRSFAVVVVALLVGACATAPSDDVVPGAADKTSPDKSDASGAGRDATRDEGDPDATSGEDAGDDGASSAVPDAGQGASDAEAGTDAGADASTADAGTDAGRTDAGTDAGRADAGTDAGRADAGTDSGTDAGTDSGTDAGTDSGTDAGTDSGTDAGRTDAGADGGTCGPASVGGFTPSPHAPNVPRSACSTTDISAFYAACIAVASTNGTCSTYHTQKLACYTCLVSDSLNATWGPLIVFPGNVLDINIGGCIENESLSRAACAHALEGEQECQHLACDATCSGSDADYNACTATAKAGGCATENAAVNAQCRNLSTAVQPCLNGTTFEDRFQSVGEVFCAL